MKTLATIALLPLAACSGLLHPLTPRVDREEVSQSVYRMSEDITVDVTPYCKAQKDTETCLEVIGKTHTFSWTGTAWTVDRMRGRSFMMTAGHMCESKSTYEYTETDLGIDEAGNLAIVERKYELPIVKAEYGFHGADGTEYTGGKVVRDDDDVDLCELQVAGDLGTPIPVADHDPDYGQHCYYTGAPGGVWGGGIAGTYEATFSGRGDMFGEGEDKLAFSALGKGGASGSPIICDGQAVAVLVEGPRRFEGMFMGTPQDDVREFHRKAHHLPKGD